MKKHSFLVPALVLFFFLSVVPISQATFMMRISSASKTVTISDNEAGKDVDPSPGRIVTGTWLLGTFDNFYVNSATGFFSQQPALAKMHFDSVDVSSDTGGLLTLELSNTGFNLPTAVPFNILSEYSTTTDGQVGFKKYFTGGEVNWGTGLLVASFGPTGSNIDSSNYLLSPAVSPFSLYDVLTVQHGSGTDLSTSFNAENTVTPIPEPATLLLLGSGLVGLAGYAKLRLKRKRDS